MSRVGEVLALTKENGSLTIQPDTEKHREVFLIWPIYDRNSNPQMLKVSISFNFEFFFMIQDDPSRSELIRPRLAV